MDGDGAFHPIPDHVGLGVGQQIQVVQLLFAAPLLDNADDDIGYHHEHEGQVVPGPHGDDGRGQHEEDHIEVGDHIGEDNLFQGF